MAVHPELMMSPSALFLLVPVAAGVVLVAGCQALLAEWSARRRTIAAMRTCDHALDAEEGAALERVVARRIRVACAAYAVAAVIAVPVLWLLTPSARGWNADGLVALSGLLVIVLAAGAVADLATALPGNDPRTARRVAGLGARRVDRYLGTLERVVPTALVVIAGGVVLVAALRGADGLGNALLVLLAGATVLAFTEAIMRRVVRRPFAATAPRQAVTEEVLVAVTVDRVAENGSSMGALALVYVLVLLATVLGVVATAVIALVGVALVAALTADRRRRVAGRDRTAVPTR